MTMANDLQNSNLRGNYDSLFNYNYPTNNSFSQPNNLNFGSESMFGGSNGGGWLTAGASALGSLGNLWAGINQTKLAKDQFNFTKGLSNRNLANSAQAYNTQLEDRTKARNSAIGTESGGVNLDNYLSKNKVNGAAI